MKARIMGTIMKRRQVRPVYHKDEPELFKTTLLNWWGYPEAQQNMDCYHILTNDLGQRRSFRHRLSLANESRHPSIVYSKPFLTDDLGAHSRPIKVKQAATMPSKRLIMCGRPFNILVLSAISCCFHRSKICAIFLTYF